MTSRTARYLRKGLCQGKVAQKGLTLVELLVGALISIIVIGGVGGIFLSVIQSNRAKMALDNSTETLRYAHYLIANQIRNAQRININGNDLILTLQDGTQDCLGGTHTESRFSFSNGSLRCSTTNAASPQEIVRGLQNVQFQFGCILTSAGTPPAREVRNANFTTAGNECDAANQYPIGEKVTTVFVTLTINPFAGEGGNARSVDFAATARGIMAPRITRIERVQADPELILELFAIGAGGSPVKAITACEDLGTVNPSQVAQATFVIRATNLSGVVQNNVTGGIALSYTDVSATSEQYDRVEFAPISQNFNIRLVDDHIRQGTRSFTVRLDDDEAFGTFENVSIRTEPVTVTINEGNCEPDNGTGPDDTTVLKLFASDPEGNILNTADAVTALEGQSVWFIVKAFDPSGNEIPDATGTASVLLTASTADANLPVNPVTVGRAFEVVLVSDSEPEAVKTFDVSIANATVGGLMIEQQFERVIASTALNENTIQVAVVDVAAETARFGTAGVQAFGSSEADIPWPTHTAGELGVLIVETSGHQVITETPTGWTQTIDPRSDIADTSGSTLHVFHRFALSNNEAPASINLPNGDHVVGRIFTFRGINSSQPIQSIPVVTVKTVNSSTVANPSAEVTANGSPILLIATRPNSTTNLEQFDVPTNSNLSGLVEVGEAGTILGNGGGFRLAVGTRTATGPIGVTTGSGPNTTNVTATVILSPRQ